jgi:hypothetical protein
MCVGRTRARRGQASGGIVEQDRQVPAGALDLPAAVHHDPRPCRPGHPQGAQAHHRAGPGVLQHRPKRPEPLPDRSRCEHHPLRRLDDSLRQPPPNPPTRRLREEPCPARNHAAPLPIGQPRPRRPRMPDRGSGQAPSPPTPLNTPVRLTPPSLAVSGWRRRRISMG